ncbi:MAG: SBBP repeat-containing protein [Verrucomicrobiae bacterium]|nr:SBBP repeat-containing protein [Verrucomicrobiae bacterium]
MVNCSAEKTSVIGFLVAAVLGGALAAEGPTSAQILSCTTTNAFMSSEVVWQQRYDGAFDDYVRGIAVDKEGDVYVTGCSFNGTNFDCVTLKYSSDGKRLWEKHYDGGYNDAGYGIAVDAQKNVYVAGFTSNGANDDVCLIKYNPTGDLLWQSRYDGGGDDCGTGVALDSAGAVYLGGTSWTTGVEWIVIKYDLSGKQLWKQSGSGFCAGIAVRAQNVYSIGNGGGEIRTYAAPNGALLWQKSSQFSAPEWWHGAGGSLAVAVDQAANAYVTGNVANTARNDMDAFLVKYAPAGEVVWKQACHDWSNDFGYGVALDETKNLYLAANDCILKIASDGGMIWRKRLPWNGTSLPREEGHYYVGGLVCDSKGNLFVCGDAYDKNRKHFDYVILKLRN